MARAVATLEGDSSGLVDAIDKAKGSMQKLESEGRKLTDQLRDVADEADKAAGALVNKIGGPTAIKAIAGIGGAFVAAETALGIFSSSMSAFASTQGAAGQKAMADLDTALNELSGELFTALMGTDDIGEAMDTLIGIVNTARDVFNLVLTPVREFAELVRELSKDQTLGAQKAREYAKAEREYKDAVIDGAAAVKSAHEQYQSLERGLIDLLGTKKELAIFDLEERKGEYKSVLAKQEAVMANKRMAESEVARKKAESAERDKAFQEQLVKERQYIAERNAYSQAAGARGTKEQMEGEARRNAEFKVERDGQVAERVYQAGKAAAREAAARVTAVDAGIEDERNKVVAGIKKLDEEIAKLRAGPDDPTKTNRTRTAPVAPVVVDAAEPAMDPYEARRLDGERFLEEERLRAEEELKILAATNKARQAMFGNANDDQIQLYYEAQIDKRIADQEEFDAARQRAIELHDLTFNFQQTAADFAAGERAKEKAAHDEKMNQLTAGFQEYGKLAGDQLAQGEKASVVAEKLAKKALGAQISALGDKAMVEAAIYAAAFNPMAIPMAAAGVAAYAAAAALGAEGKKATTATPASAAPAAAPVNTAFNLRVDAAFADGESIARQFAMMQRSAQRRGLVPAGA